MRLMNFRYSIRRLLKTPGFTIPALVVLALGIGVNTAVFNVVHTLLFAPPAYLQPKEIVQVYSQDRKDPKSYRGFSYPTYRDVRDENDVFTGALGFDIALVGLGQSGNTRRAFAAIISSNYFSVLGVPLARGRAFLPEEEIPGRPAQVVVVSYGYWQRRNLDPGVLGSEVLINGRPFTIVGIAPREFIGTTQLVSMEVWMPLSAYEITVNDFRDESKKRLSDRSGRQLMIIARLKPGLSGAAAQSQLEGLAANLEKAFPVEQKDQTFTTAPVPRLSISTSPQNESDMAILAPLLLGMSAVVLIIACLNLANMQLAQGMARHKEIAIRLAVGGNRRQIVRQLLTEGFVLAFAGGGAGFVLGVWSSGLLAASMKRLLPFEIVWMGGANAPVLLATIAFSTAATFAFALGPALRISRPAVAFDLKEVTSEDAGRRHRRLVPGHPLVVIQIAFSLALLTASALFIRGAGRASSVDTGLRPGSSFLVEVDASLAGYDRQNAQLLYQRLNQRLASLPGVERAAISATVPFGMLALSRNVQHAGLQAAPGSKPATAAEGLAFNATWNSISADYFAVSGLPLVRGREFTPGESTDSAAPPVAIVDEVLAKKLWPGGDALGQYIQYAGRSVPVAEGDSGHMGMSNDVSEEVATGEAIQVVGVVRARRQALFEKDPPGEIYVPFARGFQSNISYFVRFRQRPQGSDSAAADLIRRTVREVDPVLPVLSLRTFQQHLDANLELWLVRASAALFTVFGGLALGLAVVGLYGVRAYAVVRRTREIGIRMALGAQRWEVLKMFMRDGSVTLFCGIGLGLLLALATGRIVSGVLYQVSAMDPLAFAAACLLLALATLAATWIPALRATHVDPLKALRTE
jgi:predicted permease